MIQQEYKTNITDMSDGVVKTGFSIEANASVYAMLTQNVYNDPILAVMREWSTNACDACLAANLPVEYDVHLPNLQEPYFFVRDYGTGLPPEDIVGLFSNLGASTKRNSNLYNGTLGIGRMAGLAVADAFTIESYYQGHAYFYAVSLKDEIPVTLHLGDSPTDEEDGLKLNVTVRSNDFQYYREKANNLYKYFDFKPNINDPAVTMELDTTERISDDWFILKNSNSYDYDNYIIMSQVIYRIPRDPAINTHEFRRLVLKAPTGAVTFNPGRESLSLDKKTIDYVNQAFDNVKTDYVTASTTALAACESDKELAACFLNVTKDAPNNIARSIDPKPFMSHELQQIADLFYGNNYNIYETENFRNNTSNLLHLSKKAAYYKTARPLDGRNSVSWQQFFEASHVVIDLKTKYKQTINSYYSDKTVIMWQRQQGENLDDAVKEAKRYLKNLGLSYKLASEILAENPIVESTLLPREGLYTSCIDKRQHQVHKSQAMSETAAKDGKYLFLKLKNTTPDLKDPDICFAEYLMLYKLLEKVLPEAPPPIRGVAKKYQEFVEKLGNWVDFETYIKQEIRKQTFNYNTNKFSFSINRNISPETIKLFPKAVQNYCENAKEYKEFCQESNYLHDEDTKNLVVKLGASIKTFKPTHTITKEQLKHRFPLASAHIFEHMYGYNSFSFDDIVHLAKIEDFYAVHSTKR